ncbi:MAG: TIGR01777 family oxidoreductase [Bacteroidales bacterium]|nr:TIGR01777 family oxidoreductase [Bacteroidales bacterium]
MKIILSGTTGLIGQSLVNALLPHYQLVVISRNRFKAKQILRSNLIDYVDWNQPIVELAEAFRGSNALINLTGAGIADKPWTEKRRQELMSSRIEPMYNLTCLLASANIHLDVVIQASAIGYYGHSPDLTFTEQSPKGQGFLAEITEMWEGAATEFKRIADRIILIRSGVVLSKNGGAFPQIVKPFRMFAGGPIGHGRQYISWIHIEDEISAILHLLQDDKASGAYNLCSPNPVMQSWMAKKIGQALNRPSFLPLPAFVIKAILGRTRATELLLNSTKAIPQRLFDSHFHFKYPDIQDAIENLLSKKQ